MSKTFLIHIELTYHFNFKQVYSSYSDETDQQEVKSNHENLKEKEMKKLEDVKCNENVVAIYEYIESYMRIVRKTTTDMVPKAITLYVIKELQDYIDNNLLVDFISLPNDAYVST